MGVALKGSLTVGLLGPGTAGTGRSRLLGLVSRPRAHLHPNLFGCAERVQNAAHNLCRPRAAAFVHGLPLHQLGVRQDDAELIVQPMEEATKFSWLIHVAALGQIHV